MKRYLLLLTAAALVASCSESDSIKEVVTPDTEIGFSTYTGKQTRAENSSATETDALEAYNTTFKIWGSKFFPDDYKTPADEDNLPDEERVFGIDNVGEVVSNVVSNNVSSWTYSPKRFWDKSATSYSFYAAAPSGKSWVWDNSTKKLSLVDFAITGYNSVTGTPAIEVDVDKVLTETLDTEDLMISTDLTGYDTYTSANVNLHFNHILSRLNIGVRKSSDLDDFDVKLNSIKVYNMKSNGTFNESLATGTTLSDGTIARWATAPTTQNTFTDGIGYEPATALEITSTATTANTYYQYVYEGLAIPQEVAYNQTVSVKEYTAAADKTNLFKLDGSNATTTSAPYIVIDYEIWTKAVAAVNYTQAEADEYNQTNNLTSGEEGFKTTNDVKTPAVAAAKMDGYKYYYNLADVFNGTTGEAASAGVKFCEGWQNTLKITLAPVAINFDADVYEWATKEDVAINIPEN